MAYTKPSISGYNDDPPSNDGSQVASNQLDWDKHEEELSGPVKTLAEAINDATETAFDDLASTATDAAGDALVGGKRTSTGASAFTIHTYNEKRKIFAGVDFGCVEGDTDNSTALQAAIDAAVAEDWTLVLDGMYQHNSPLNARTDLTIEGLGIGFQSGLKPIETSCLRFDRVAEGNDVFNINLRNFMIDCGSLGSAANIDAIVYWSGFYRSAMDNIRLRSTPIGLGAGEVAAGVKVGPLFSYENRFERVYVVGAGNTGGGQGFDIDHTSGVVVLIQPDAENMYRGIYLGGTGGGSTEIHTPHLERDGTSVYIEANHERVIIDGGVIDLASATSSGIILNGAFTNDEMIIIDGLKFTSNDHAAKKNAIVTSAISDWTTQKMQLNNIDWSWINVATDLSQYANFKIHSPLHSVDRQEFSFRPTLADATDKDIFNITTSNYEPVYVRIRTFCEHNGYGLVIDESVWMITKQAAAGYYISTKTNILNQIDNNSGNYNFISLALTGTANGSTDVSFKINCDFITTIFDSVDPVISVEVVGEAAITGIASASITGTATDTIDESDVVTGGKTIVITLHNDTWVSTVGDDNAITTALIAGIDSAQSEGTGWDAVVKANMVHGDMVRTSDTVVTITLAAEATYDITAQETITVTIPSTAVTLAAAITGDNTFTVDTV